MIGFNRFVLDNGLKIIVHEDRSTPIVAMNLLYDVGARDEDPEMTGLAHLFEHLMFGGSLNIPVYDTPLLMVGGDNNAFTNNDITNYYLTVPAENIETGFWLESDRMLGLDFSEKHIETEKKVVMEEFRQRYLNQPYGDASLKIHPLAYKVHPYRWSAIGMDLSHIEKANIEDIKQFYYSHYAPNNAILTLSGNIDLNRARFLAEKWFGPIERRKVKERSLPVEPPQLEKRILTLEKDVPATAIYNVWHIGPRLSDDFSTMDLITDLLAGGESGLLYTKLVREEKLFTEINAYISSDIDPGLIFIQGKLMKGISIDQAEDGIGRVINSLRRKKSILDDFEKVKNKFEATTVFSNTNILHKATNLSYYELLGNIDMINSEVDSYRNVSFEMVNEALERYFKDSNCSTIYYKTNRND